MEGQITPKGNHKTKYYVCANMRYRDSKFKENDVTPLFFGHCSFADFSHLKPPALPNCIVEIHGLGSGWANVGIYTDDLNNISDDIQIQMIFSHIGNACFKRFS